MTAYTTLTVTRHRGVATVTLQRPELHNAFNEVVIAELSAAFGELGADPKVRVVILAGEGPSFCAGADLNWMRAMAGYDVAQNRADAADLARMLRSIDACPKPTIARVHGAAFGGGVGLVACCDIAIAAVEATFALSEARLGLVAATISPYVIEAIGARAARRYFVTAERFDAAEAYRIGLVHDLVPIGEIDDRVNAILRSLLAAGPVAQHEGKMLVRRVAGQPIDAALIADTVELITRVRASPEGKEGVAAFLDKRPAAWVPPELAARKR